MTHEQSELAAEPRAWRRWWIVGASAIGFGAWFLGSILLHAGLFGVLYLASPKTRRPEAAADLFHMTVSPGHIAAVVADIRAQQKEEFSKKIAELASVKTALDALDAKKLEQYNALMKDAAKQAPRLAQESAAKARAGQEATLQAQAAAQDAIARMNAADARGAGAQNDDEKTSAANDLAAAAQAAQQAQAAASQAQKTVAAAQAETARQVNLFGDAATDANHSAQTAAADQQAAAQQQETATTSRAALLDEREKAAPAAQEVQRARTADDTAKERVDGVEKRLSELQPPPAPSPEPPPTAPALPDATGVVATAEAAVAAQLSPTPVPAPSKKAQEEIDRLTKALPQATDAKAKAAAHLVETEQALAARRAEVARAFAKLQADEDKAHQEQQIALEAQLKADGQIAATLAKPDLAISPAAPSFSPAPTVPSEADLSQLFEQARQMETVVADAYKNVRAAELAAIRKIPLSQALALTEVAKPVREKIDTSILTRDIRDVPSVREQEKALQAASGQMDAMVALAQRMKDLAQPAQDASVTVETMKATAAHSERMEQLASEDEGMQAKDLTAAMQGTGSSSEEAHGSGDAATAKLTEAIRAAAVKLAANPLDPVAMSEYRQAMEALNAQRVRPPGGGAGGSAESVASASAVPAAPAMDVLKLRAIPGRTINHSMVAGPPGRDPSWMFVDSWYIIGPWPNPGRKNLNTTFPPESVVDLDAVYSGGRQNEAPLPVQWRFYQGSAVRKSWTSENTGMIVPPGLGEFEIYYAYTELWFDEAADLWVAIGSDDQSKIWLNDQMIWKSADYYKSWAANEGLRKVHFDKGINRLLYRLENGQLSGGFSFMVCLNPSAPPPPEAKLPGPGNAAVAH